MLVVFLALAVACGDQTDTPETKPAGNSSPVQHQAEKYTILKLFNEAASIDSLVILYFTDTINFRYYTFYSTAEAADLSTFKENLVTDTVSNNSCIKEGTIYGYIRGSIYTTLYFNLTDGCKFLRLFKNGRLFNYPLSNSLRVRLQILEKLAKNP